jgi:hypothetical protein
MAEDSGIFVIELTGIPALLGYTCPNSPIITDLIGKRFHFAAHSTSTHGKRLNSRLPDKASASLRAPRIPTHMEKRYAYTFIPSSLISVWDDLP